MLPLRSSASAPPKYPFTVLYWLPFTPPQWSTFTPPLTRSTNSATAIPASASVYATVVVSPKSAVCKVTATTVSHPATACSALCARCVLPPFIFAMRVSWSLGSSTPCWRCASCACGHQPHQVFACRSLDARRLGLTGQKLLIAFTSVPPYDRAHRRASHQGDRIDANPFALLQSAVGKQTKNPGKPFMVRLHIN